VTAFIALAFGDLPLELGLLVALLLLLAAVVVVGQAHRVYVRLRSGRAHDVRVEPSWAAEVVQERINDNVTEISVRVTAGSLSLRDTAVQIEQLTALEAVSDDARRQLGAFKNLPFRVHGTGRLFARPESSATIHPGSSQTFDAVTLQKINAETVIWHAAGEIRYNSASSPQIWTAIPSQHVPNGRYRLTLIVVATDVEPKRLSVEFENREGASGVWEQS
jgi:hypothetical protein